MSANTNFLSSLTKELTDGVYFGRYNELRFGPARSEEMDSLKGRLSRIERGVKTRARRQIARTLGRNITSKYVSRTARAIRRLTKNPSVDRLAELLVDLDDHEQAWGAFADERSRKVYIRLLALRALGPPHVRLPLDDAKYWQDYDIASSCEPMGDPLPGGLGFLLCLFDLRPFGYNLTVRCRAGSLLAHCLQRQYELIRPEGRVTIEEGDVVIDGGAAWGETALMFSAKTGPAGRVVAVECVPEVLSVFYENMALNPSDGERIDLVNQALWDVCDETVIFEEDGPASKVLGVAGRANTGTTHTTVTIDELVRRFELPKVDFIKMDIEGSELAALVGASDTLRRFRPKLAVSAYHKPEDLHVLPLYLSGLGLGYRLFLDHFSNHFEESVLFAVVD